MTDSSNEDSVTKLNTQLNKSMILMENVADTPSQNHKRNKSIKINTTAQPPSASNSPAVKSRKSILKKSDKSFSESKRHSASNEVVRLNGSIERLNDRISQRSSSSTLPSRPYNLQELAQEEILDAEAISSELFDLDDISDSEDIWIMDIPKSIDPRELNGQAITLGDKSKIKIRENRYCAVTQNRKCNVTCVFNAGKETPRYKTANIKPVGLLTLRRKLTGILKTEPMSRNSSLPMFPVNLKMRHPLFGVIYDGKFRRKSRKHSSFKKKMRT